MTFYVWLVFLWLSGRAFPGNTHTDKTKCIAWIKTSAKCININVCICMCVCEVRLDHNKMVSVFLRSYKHPADSGHSAQVSMVTPKHSLRFHDNHRTYHLSFFFHPYTIISSSRSLTLLLFFSAVRFPSDFLITKIGMKIQVPWCISLKQFLLYSSYLVPLWFSSLLQKKSGQDINQIQAEENIKK